MRFQFFCLVITMIQTITAFGQDCHLALHGTVFDSETSGGLPFATVTIPATGKGTVADEHGHYTISDLCEGVEYLVDISHVDCAHQLVKVQLIENTLVDFHLEHTHNTLAEVQISAKSVVMQTSEAQSTISRSQLEQGQSKGLASAIERVPGVYVLTSGQNAAKPIIQGMNGNRVAIVQQGVVIEGQQWGADHAPEVDAFSADQVQVIKGASGVRYGVGALGGAVILKDAPWSDSAVYTGSVQTGFSANGGTAWLALAQDLQPDGSDWKFRVQGSLKHGGNQHTPDYFLGNTGMCEQNLRFAAQYQARKDLFKLHASVFHQKFGILKSAHTGNLTDLQNAIVSPIPLNNQDLFTYQIDKPYQDVAHYLLKGSHIRPISSKWTWENILSWQYNIRKEYDAHRNGGANTQNKPALSFYNYTSLLESMLRHKPIRHWTGDFGVQGMWQYNQTGTGGYVPDQKTWAASVYAIEHWRRYPHPFEYEAGLRIDYRQTHVTDTVGTLRKLDTTLVFANASANLGLIWSPNEYAHIRLNSALAWRPPSMIELYARGVHHGAASYEQGRPDLRAEKAWNNSIDLTWAKKRLQLQLISYANVLQNFVYLQPENSSVLTIRGAYPLYTYQQTDALILGADAQLGVRVLGQWGVVADASMIRGRQRQAERDEWLPLLPPDRLRIALVFDGLGDTWKVSKTQPFTFRLGYAFIAQQTRVPAQETLLAAPPAYALWDAQLGWSKILKSKQTLFLGLSSENLANTSYRSYLNFFRFFADETGRQINLRIKFTF